MKSIGTDPSNHAAEGDERPVQRDDGRWDALDANGYGHSLGYESAELVEAWLAGYECGAQENM